MHISNNNRYPNIHLHLIKFEKTIKQETVEQTLRNVHLYSFHELFLHPLPTGFYHLE